MTGRQIIIDERRFSSPITLLLVAYSLLNDEIIIYYIYIR